MHIIKLLLIANAKLVKMGKFQILLRDPVSALMGKSTSITIADSAKMEKLQILKKQNVNVQMDKPSLITTAKSAKMEQCQIPTRLLVSALWARHF